MSTAPGRGGIAVVRVSGPLARAAIETLTGRQVPIPRRAALRDLAHGGTAIDRGLVLYFSAPGSFTGEDMAEFHIHGGRAVTRSLALALEALGARQAEPGEFTKRAYLNGRIDLTEAEAIADLIDAESAAQQAQALAQADGALSRLYEGWSARLSRLLAHMEASLDFADEELPGTLLEDVSRETRVLAAEIAAHLADARRGERLRQGLRIAILGAPNTGKSSLLNALAQRDIAIVSARAGTTRDAIEVHLDLGGYPVIVVDTAGLRDTADEIEREGIARARAHAGEADIKLLLFDGTAQPDGATLALRDENALVVVNKADLLSGTEFDSSSETGPPLANNASLRCNRDNDGGDHPLPHGRGIMISTVTGKGMAELLETLATMAADRMGDLSRPPPTRERHATYLRTALAALRSHDIAATPDLAAEELRGALLTLGRITGRVDVEDLLDVVFREFCIGK